MFNKTRNTQVVVVLNRTYIFPIEQGDSAFLCQNPIARYTESQGQIAHPEILGNTPGHLVSALRQ